MNTDINKVALAASLFLLGKSMSRNSIPQVRNDSVIFTITGPRGENVILPEMDIAITPSESILDISIRVFDEFNLPYEIAGFGKDAYILSIDNISQYEEGPESRWLYNVDGNYPPMSPGEYIPTADARIEWIYTTNGGKDIGTPSNSFDQRNNNLHFK